MRILILQRYLSDVGVDIPSRQHQINLIRNKATYEEESFYVFRHIISCRITSFQAVSPVQS